MHRLDTTQGNLLADMMAAVRPDWARNNPRGILRAANTPGFGQAHDFGHMVRALAHYATARDRDGSFRYRTPNLFPEAGEHWSRTAPGEWDRPVGRRCAEHPDFEAANCRCCWSEIRDPDMPRTEAELGKRLQGAPQDGGRAITPEERGRLREWALRAAHGMREDGGTMQEGSETA